MSLLEISLKVSVVNLCELCMYTTVGQSLQFGSYMCHVLVDCVYFSLSFLFVSHILIEHIPSLLIN